MGPQLRLMLKYIVVSQGFYARATAMELMLSIILFIGIIFIQSWFRKGRRTCHEKGNPVTFCTGNSYAF